VALFVYFENEACVFLTFILCNFEKFFNEIAKMKALGTHENMEKIV